MSGKIDEASVGPLVSNAHGGMPGGADISAHTDTSA
jgi:hypothetical protein